MKTKPKVGQSVILVRRRRRHQEVEPMQVSKVGSKYFYLRNPAGGHLGPFHNYTWIEKTNFTADHYVYETLQEIEDEEELKKLVIELRSVFAEYFGAKLNLDQARKISQLLKELGL
jgi:hypothetical protein